MKPFFDSPLLAWISILLVSYLYVPLNKRPAKAYLRTLWDSRIPLVPVWVYGYISYYPFVVLSCILLPLHPSYGTQFTVSYLVGSVIAASIWYLYPTGVKRPILPEKKSLPRKILEHLYTHDGDANAAPSGHVLHTLICGYYLWLSFPQYILPILLMMSIICLSTVLVKQHYVVDIPAGLLVGCIGILAGRILIG